MAIEIKVPVLPESVADATIMAWHKKIGEAVRRDENLLDLETDKVVLEVPAPEDGVLKAIQKNPDEVVTAGEILALFEPGAVDDRVEKEGAKQPESVAVAKAVPTAAEKASAPPSGATLATTAGGNQLSPSQRRSAAEQGLSADQIAAQSANIAAAAALLPREEKRVPMTRLRQRVAERLVAVKQTTAMLTTFNEVDMSAVMTLRQRYKAQFEKQHDVRLGFMSFFTKAVVESLKRFPDVNASIDGSDIIYHNYFDIGIAVSTERGLVVPVLRDANQMGMAAMESTIRDFAKRGREGKLTLEEITGGNFTITNGGVFGSMLSTPILNPPQSAILGMHNIVERPVAIDGEVVIRPMMYLALSYDHRIVDGKDSVSFLVAIKSLLEDPARLLLDI